MAERRFTDLVRFAASALPTGLAAVLQFAVFALTARALGPDLFGRLAVVYGVAAMAVEVVGLGADEVIVRRASADQSAYRRAAGHASAMILGTLPVIALIAIALAWMLVPEFPVWVVAALVLADIILQRAIAFMEKTMVAHHQAVRASLVRVIGTATRALVAVFVFVGLQNKDVPVWAAGSFLQSGLIAILLGLATIRLYGSPTRGLLRGEISFGVMYMTTHLSRVLQANLDRILLAPILAAAALGVYAAATRLLILGTVMLQSALRIYYPRFFVAAKKGPGALRAHMLSTAKVMVLVGILAAIAIAIAGRILPFILGDGYEEVASLTVPIAMSMPFLALQYPAGDALTAMDRQDIRMIVSLTGAALFSFGLVGGALAAGLTGAAVMYAVGHCALAVALWLAALDQLKRQAA